MMKMAPVFTALLVIACRAPHETANDGSSPSSTAAGTVVTTTAATTTTATSTTTAASTIPSTASSVADAATAPPVTGPKLPPADESKADPSLVAYLDTLRTAVQKRDIGAVIAAADPTIRTSFGEGGGAASLRKMLERPELWSELEQILKLGGTFLEGSNQKAFWAPYVYSEWPDREDAFEALAVIGDEVPLRSTPDGPAIATLSYDIVTRAGDPDDGWQKIRTADGRTGVVETRFLRSPVGYRAGFNKTGDTWRMTGLVAGD
jgi:hypothetical protein